MCGEITYFGSVYFTALNFKESQLKGLPWIMRWIDEWMDKWFDRLTFR
jgi:hypothetical protein